MQHELAVFVDDGMSGIAAALEAHDHVEFFGQKVYHPTLAFVSPVDAHDRGAFSQNSRLPSDCYSSSKRNIAGIVTPAPVFVNAQTGGFHTQAGSLCRP